MKTSALSKFLNLLLEESDYRKTSYFAEKLMVSNKTISNYITELRYHMKEYELDITAKHGVGIRMEGDQSAVKPVSYTHLAVWDVIWLNKYGQQEADQKADFTVRDERELQSLLLNFFDFDGSCMC